MVGPCIPKFINDCPTMPFPTETIKSKNGLIVANLLLPETGAYKATRFDYSGQIANMEYKGKKMLGKWFKSDNVTDHDSICGAVDEFVTPLGFGSEATFVRIGVGILEKPKEDSEYIWNKLYKIVDSGKWNCKVYQDSVEYEHVVSGDYSYEYKKVITLKDAGFTISHSLKNTSKNHFKTDTYNHNFFIVEPIGPFTKLTVPFTLNALLKPWVGDSFAHVDGKSITFTRSPKPVGDTPHGESFFCIFDGYNSSPSDYDFTLHYEKSKLKVRIRCDKAIGEKVVVWACPSTFCPEGYLDIQVAPGETINWTYTYDFMEEY